MKVVLVSLACAVLAFVIFSSDVSALAIKSNIDPKVFVEDSALKINEECSLFFNIPKVLEDYKYEDRENKKDLIKKLKICAETLKQISAKAFVLEPVQEKQSQHEIRKLHYWGGALKLGEDSILLGKNIESLLDLYTTADIEVFNSDDTQYSMKDITLNELNTYNPDESKYYWSRWNDKLNGISKDKFFHTVKTIQTTAKKYNMTAAEFWFPDFSDKVMLEMDETMKSLKPFYQRIHGFVRDKLFQKYGAGIIKPYGPIPENYARNFLMTQGAGIVANFLDIHYLLHGTANDLPNFSDYFDEKSSESLLQEADKFYKSMGFKSLDEDFFYNVNVKQDEVCAGDIYTGPKKTNLNICSKTNFWGFLEYHTLLGKAHAAQLKKELPVYYFDGYALDDVVGGAVRLAALSPKHIKKIALPDDNEFEFTNEIITNMNSCGAITRMFTITYSYVNAKVLIAYLNGKVKKHNLNKYYWDLMEEHAGLEPSVDRSENSLDLPYSLYLQVNDHTNIINEFRTHILTYQFFRGICQQLDHSGSLLNCDFYENTDVGYDLQNILAFGSSKPFADVVEPILKKNTKLDVTALLSYYEKANNALTEYFETHKNIKLGWEHSKKHFSKRMFTSEDDAREFTKKSSEKIYKIYEQITADLFLEKHNSDDYTLEDGEHTFWKISNTAVAAGELKDISFMAQQFDVSKFSDKALKKAITKLAKIADIYVLGSDMDEYMDKQRRLNSSETDEDIPKFNRTNDEDTVAYYPDIENLFSNSTNAKELEHYWVEWRNTNSWYLKRILIDVLEYTQKAAETLQISASQFWLKDYHTGFVDRIETVLMDLKPLYEKLHDYMRSRLVDGFLGEEFISPSGAIPDHVLEQQLKQLWTSNSVVQADFPVADLPVYDTFIAEKQYDALHLLHTADEFYESLGFTPMPEEFWKERVLPYNKDENLKNCHATIYDKTPKVYLKYCEKVDYRKLLQAHGYMGRVHYAVEKRDLPAYFFDSYFLEYPVGEAVILSAATPKHAEKIGLLKDGKVSEQVLLNRMIRMAIHTLFKLHKHFVHTKVISDYLQGEIEEDNIAKYYWKLMVKYAGIEPPVDRNDDSFDFPIDFYYDVEENYQLKKFVSDVLGYQMYEAFCKLSGHEGDLNSCDFYGSKEAGEKFKEMMKMGSSEFWPEVVRVLIPDFKFLSADSLLKYYAPLNKWLDDNSKTTPFWPYNSSFKNFYTSEDFIKTEDEE